MMALAAANAKDKLTMFRDKALQMMDQWVNSLAPALLGDKPLTLEDISSLFEEKKKELLSALVTDFIEVHHQELCEQGLAPCPNCGKLCKCKRHTSRRVESLQGSSKLERPYFLCHDCKIGFAPLDAALQLSGRQKQYDLQRLALDYIAEMPYETASELFAESLGISFSENTMHDFLADFSQDLSLEEVIPSAEIITQRIAEVRGDAKRRPVLVVATDGAHLPTRPLPGRKGTRGPGEYKEAKGFRMYLLGGGGKIVQLASWHQIQNADDCAAALKIAAARVPTDQVRIALIGDGAPWVWRAMTEAFPSGREVLDYYHCSEHIHAVASAQYADDQLKALQWVEASMSNLYYGEVTRVIGGLKRMQPKNKESEEQIRKLIVYLNNNAHRIDYAHNRRGGYSIGSGGIESANKFICHVRMKRSGAWWLKDNGNTMLALRCAKVNGTLDDAFKRYVARNQQQRFLVRTNS